MNKQAQGECVHPVALGERGCLAHKTSKSLAQGVVEAFDVAGLTCAFVGAAVGAPGNTSSYASQKSLRVARQR